MPAEPNHSARKTGTKPWMYAKLNPRVTTNAEMRLAKLNHRAEMNTSTGRWLQAKLKKRMQAEPNHSAWKTGTKPWKNAKLNPSVTNSTEMIRQAKLNLRAEMRRKAKLNRCKPWLNISQNTQNRSWAKLNRRGTEMNTGSAKLRQRAKLNRRRWASRP
jgi:hypothetical protein